MIKGKENLDAILGTRVNFIKEGLGFNPTEKKEFEMKTFYFHPGLGLKELTLLLNMENVGKTTEKGSSSNQNSKMKTTKLQGGKKKGRPSQFPK